MSTLLSHGTGTQPGPIHQPVEGGGLLQPRVAIDISATILLSPVCRTLLYFPQETCMTVMSDLQRARRSIAGTHISTICM